MTEHKSIYDDGTCGFGDDIPFVIAKWSNPEIGYITMNGEPLSTKQLHDLITSQSMTIDRLLGEVGEYRAAFELILSLRGSCFTSYQDDLEKVFETYELMSNK